MLSISNQFDAVAHSDAVAIVRPTSRSNEQNWKFQSKISVSTINVIVTMVVVIVPAAVVAY